VSIDSRGFQLSTLASYWRLIDVVTGPGSPITTGP
jgi:hypothetical protein